MRAPNVATCHLSLLDCILLSSTVLSLWSSAKTVKPRSCHFHSAPMNRPLIAQHRDFIHTSERIKIKMAFCAPTCFTASSVGVIEITQQAVELIILALRLKSKHLDSDYLTCCLGLVLSILDTLKYRKTSVQSGDQKRKSRLFWGFKSKGTFKHSDCCFSV